VVLLISVEQSTCIICAKDRITMTSVPINLILLLLKWQAGSWNTDCSSLAPLPHRQIIIYWQNCQQTRKQASHVLISHIKVFFFTSDIRTTNFVPWISLFPVGLDTSCEQKFQKPSVRFPSIRQETDKTNVNFCVKL